jgi:hypothetical protein
VRLLFQTGYAKQSFHAIKCEGTKAFRPKRGISFQNKNDMQRYLISAILTKSPPRSDLTKQNASLAAPRGGVGSAKVKNKRDFLP